MSEIVRFYGGLSICVCPDLQPRFVKSRILPDVNNQFLFSMAFSRFWSIVLPSFSAVFMCAIHRDMVRIHVIVLEFNLVLIR